MALSAQRYRPARRSGRHVLSGQCAAAGRGSGRTARRRREFRTAARLSQGADRSARRLHLFRPGRRARLRRTRRRARHRQARGADRPVALRRGPGPGAARMRCVRDAARPRQIGRGGDRHARRPEAGGAQRGSARPGALARGAAAVPAEGAGRFFARADRRGRGPHRGGDAGDRAALGRAGDADRHQHRPVALPCLRRSEAHRRRDAQAHRRLWRSTSTTKKPAARRD